MNHFIIFMNFALFRILRFFLSKCTQEFQEFFFEEDIRIEKKQFAIKTYIFAIEENEFNILKRLTIARNATRHIESGYHKCIAW